MLPCIVREAGEYLSAMRHRSLKPLPCHVGPRRCLRRRRGCTSRCVAICRAFGQQRPDWARSAPPRAGSRSLAAIMMPARVIHLSVSPSAYYESRLCRGHGRRKDCASASTRPTSLAMLEPERLDVDAGRPPQAGADRHPYRLLDRVHNSGVRRLRATVPDGRGNSRLQPTLQM